VSVLGPLRIFNALATCYFVYSLRISAIAFFIVFVYCVTIGEGAFSSVIRGYTPNTNRVGTRLSKLVVLLRALNIICRTISLSIPGSSTTIIW
jgi:hypothetical protein